MSENLEYAGDEQSIGEVIITYFQSFMEAFDQSWAYLMIYTAPFFASLVTAYLFGDNASAITGESVTGWWLFMFRGAGLAIEAIGFLGFINYQVDVRLKKPLGQSKFVIGGYIVIVLMTTLVFARDDWTLLGWLGKLVVYMIAFFSYQASSRYIAEFFVATAIKRQNQRRAMVNQAQEDEKHRLAIAEATRQGELAIIQAEVEEKVRNTKAKGKQSRRSLKSQTSLGETDTGSNKPRFPTRLSDMDEEQRKSWDTEGAKFLMSLGMPRSSAYRLHKKLKSEKEALDRAEDLD